MSMSDVVLQKPIPSLEADDEGRRHVRLLSVGLELGEHLLHHLKGKFIGGDRLREPIVRQKPPDPFEVAHWLFNA